MSKEAFANLAPVKITSKNFERFLENIVFGLKWRYPKDLGVNPSFIEVTYKFIFSLHQLLKLNIRNTRGNMLNYYGINIGQADFALVYHFAKVPLKVVFPNFSVNPLKLQKVRRHHYIKTVIIGYFVHFLI